MSILEQIADINSICLGKDDWYSKHENLVSYNKNSNFKYIYIKGYEGEVVGYLLYWQYEDCLEGLRSGVLPEYQGKGLGKRLFKRMMRLSDKLQIPYWTYSSGYNYTSVSSHIRAGMKIEKIREDNEGLWIDLIYKPRKG